MAKILKLVLASFLSVLLISGSAIASERNLGHSENAMNSSHKGLSSSHDRESEESGHGSENSESTDAEHESEDADHHLEYCESEDSEASDELESESHFSAVTGLVAVAGNNQVSLSWNPAVLYSAASYGDSWHSDFYRGYPSTVANLSSPTNMHFASVMSPIATYQIRYSTNSGSSWVIWPITTTSTSLVISPLDPSLTYIFQVGTVGNDDDGSCATNWSDSSNSVTPTSPGPPPAILYTVNFAADGVDVSGSPEFSSATQATAGAAITLPLEGTMVKLGYYTFMGWSETIDGPLVSDPFTPISNITLHPVFLAMARYQVTLNVDSTIRAEVVSGRYFAPDGALTDLTANPGSSTVIPVQTLQDNLSAAWGQLELYLPKGVGNPISLAASHYLISIADANGTRNYLGQSLNPAGMVWTIFGFTGDTTITIKRAPLLFDSRGGTAVLPGAYTANGSVALPAQPSNGALTFLGWFTAISGGSPVGWPYTPDGSSDVTLYAHWQ